MVNKMSFRSGKYMSRRMCWKHAPAVRVLKKAVSQVSENLNDKI